MNNNPSSDPYSYTDNPTCSLNIGLDAKRAYFNTRGIGNYSRDTIRILSTFSPQNNYYLFTPGAAVPPLFCPADCCRTVTPSSAFDKRFSSVWRTYRLTNEVLKHDIALYHGLSHELPVGIEKTNVRTVVTMHDLIFMKNPELYPAIDCYFYKKKYGRSCRVADKIIAISQQTKADLIEWFHIDEKKIEVVYQGCSPLFRRTVSDRELKATKEKYGLPDKFVLSVGAIEKRKNHLLVLEAMRKANIDFPVVIVGRKTHYLDELEKKITDYKLNRRVQVFTQVSAAELPHFYQSASLFVYPSLTEGFGIPIIEALTSSLPVITSVDSCFQEAGGEGALYINPCDSEALAEAVTRLLQSESDRQKLILEGRKHVQQFNDEHIARQLFSLYKKIL